MRLAALLLLVAMIGRADASPQIADAPAYRPEQTVTGTIRIWGHEYMSAVTKYWAEGFQRFHPGVKFEIELMGSATAMPGLYSGRADIALLGRENNVTDDNGFFRPKQYRPVRFDLMTGSLDVPGKSAALFVFVHKDNPLAQLTLAQLDAIFGCEHRRGLSNIRTWGELGLKGEWADKPIRLYTYDAPSGTGLFFQKVVMKNSRKMNWENVTEYRDTRNSDGTLYRSGQQIIDAMKQDRYGLAVSSLRYAHAGIKPVALAAEESQPAYHATKDNLIARRYPLTRQAYAFIDRPPGPPLDPKVKEFLRYVFSREGQADIERERGYLPLSPAVLTEQLGKLQD